jgi:hypothetical protein
VPTCPPAPLLRAERRGQGRTSLTAAPDGTPIAEHAFGTRLTALRHAGAGPDAMLAAALAHRAAMSSDPGVLGRVRHASDLGAVRMLPVFGRFMHSLTHLGPSRGGSTHLAWGSDPDVRGQRVPGI